LQVIKQGAEAVLYKTSFGGREAVLKDRLPKKYRNEKLDAKIRKTRTRIEAALLRKARGLGVNTPEVYDVDAEKGTICMQFVQGGIVKDILRGGENLEICREIGKNIARMHEGGLIHGDLTTSNIISHKDGLFFIDFGLGFEGRRIEDMAVDLLVFRKTFEATHCTLMRGWDYVIEGYGKMPLAPQVLKQMEKVEKRRRYA
jgi:Kae1-associated kinase Bud32